MAWLANIAFIFGYYLKRAHWLSLDVVAGAMVTHSIALRLPDGHGKVYWASTLLVGIAVFIIYVIDRLLDNRKPNFTPTPRHRFHAKYEPVLFKIVAGLGVLGFICLFWLPSNMLLIGFVLAIVAGVYLWVVYRTSSHSNVQLLKEPFVALIYTLGIWGTALRTTPDTSWESIVFMVLFGLVALQNLLLFSWFESFEVEEGYSLAIAWGTETLSAVLNGLAIVVVLTAIGALCVTQYRYCVRTSITVALMSICMHLLKRQSAQVIAQERYRWLGDGVFFFTLWLI
jgi:hypothetical protein